MATAPSVTIGSISSGASATRPIKAIGLSSTQVTVGDPIETTVSYYTGPRSSQATLSNLALQLTTDTSGALSTHYVEYGNSVQYNQSIGLRCVASNSSGLSSEDLGFVYGNYVFFPVPKVTSIETDNGDNTVTTVFTLEFDNGAANAPVKVQYRSASGHITSYSSSAWSSWTTSDQETIAAENTGTQIIHYTVTTASNAEMSFNFRLTTGSSWSSWSDYSRTIFYANPNVHLYGSVNGQAKEIRKLYGSVNGQTKEIKKLYGSVNGQAKRIL